MAKGTPRSDGSRKLRDDDDSTNSSLKKRKGSPTSGSMTTETSGLRRSSRETHSKKQQQQRAAAAAAAASASSSPLSIRKSERIEKRTPKKSSIPLKKSDGVEQNQSSSSSASKKGLKFVIPIRKNKDREKNEEDPATVNAIVRSKNQEEDDDPATVNDIVQSENQEENRKPPVRIIFRKKKRLDARTYRALLPLPPKRLVLDPSEKLNGHDGLSQGDGDNAEASGSKAVNEGAEGCDRKGEELRGEESGENCAQAVEGTSSGSGKKPTGRPRSYGETHISHFVRKLKNGPEEGKWNNGFNSPASKCSGGSLQSSPGVLAKEGVSHAERIQLGCSTTEVLQNAEQTESTSEGISTSGNRYLGKPYSVGSSKRKRNSEDLDSVVSAPASNKETCISADAFSSSMLENKSSNFLEQCVTCSKRKRLDLDSRKNICVCNAETSYDSCNTLFPEDGGELRERVSAGPTEEGTELDLDESPSEAQMESDHNACVICKHNGKLGKLLFCDGKGCNRGYHFGCLDPPLNFVPPGSWHCFWCVKKKMRFGVHSVSKGVDSIWDVREEVFDDKGAQKQRQYLVKYSGLAHVHNRWIPEKQLLVEAPTLLVKYKKNQVLRWKPEWARPHRLLQKRLLMSPKQHDEQLSEDHGDSLDCQYEWYVKWTGLGYEHATWELENSPLLRSSEAMTLIKEYESRRQKAKRAADPPGADKERKGSFCKLSKLPCSGLSGLDNDQLSFVNKLRECWHKDQNAVVVEDQERILKVILFILSIESDVRRPFLVISTSSCIPAWEAELGRVAPSLGVVAYTGSKDVRESIRATEFHEEGGCILFQVLLSTPEVIIEDLQTLDCIKWESIVVDECQLSKMSRHFEKIKMLTTVSKLLLVSGQIKDCIAEYLSLLSFIDSGGDKNGDESNVSIGKLKETFARFIVCERKSDSKFVEYWVPVRLSNIQLEQYCGTLLSSSITLRSCSKNDPVGALRDILVSCRKCCDHPYLVDQSLQPLITKGLPEVEYLNVGVDASGKLQFLDKILSQVKQQGLRVLVLFQSIGGSGRNSIGDILDDFVRQRYGPDSYERVDSGLVTAKKQAALNMFNNKERGRFVFLIENRACLPSIKLSSVDLIILFDSDWNPLNDIRALQKISIVDSQYEQLKIFRLYSAFTVEEKVLSLAKKDMMTLDSNVQNINCSTSHMLLIWGSSYLFKKLDEFHAGCTQSSVSSISTEQSYMNDVVQEFLTLLQIAAENKTENCSFISKVHQSGATYSKKSPLPGELVMHSKDEESPHAFWTNLLEGRHPRWRFSSGPSQRIRKKVQYFDELQTRPQVVEKDEAVKKGKKVGSNTIDPNSSDLGNEDKRKVTSKLNEGASGTPVSTDSQKNLRPCLQTEVSKLCEVLKLPEGVTCVAGKFFEYIMDNHHVTSDPTIFQALKISVCWSAASLSKHKINHQESLALAKQHLNFECKEAEANSVYDKMRPQKKLFRHRAKKIDFDFVDSPAARIKEVEKHNPKASTSLSGQPELEEGEIGESPEGASCSNQQDSAKQEQRPNSEGDKVSVKTEISKAIEQVKKTYKERKQKIIDWQLKDIKVFNKIMKKTVHQLEADRNTASIIVRNLHRQKSVRLEKLKMLDQNFDRKMEELSLKKKELADMRHREKQAEKLLKAHWVKEAESGKRVDTYAKQPLLNSEFRLEYMDNFFQNEVAHEEATTLHGTSPEIQDCDGVTPEIGVNQFTEPPSVVNHTGGSDSGSSRTGQQTQTDSQLVQQNVTPARDGHDPPELQDPNGGTPHVPDGEACPEASETEVNQCTEPPPVVNQTGEVNDEAIQHIKLGASDGGSSRIGEQTPTDSQLAQQHVTPARDGQDSSLQVLTNSTCGQIPIVEQAQPSMAAAVQAEHVSHSEVLNSLCSELQFPRPGEGVASIQSGPTPTEQSQADIPGDTLNDREQSNEEHTGLQGASTQPEAEVFSSSNLPHNMQFQHGNQSRDTSSQLADGAVCLSALRQTELLNNTVVSQLDAHLQYQPSRDTSVSGSGTRLSDSRSTTGLVPESSQRHPTVHPTVHASSRMSQQPQYSLDPLRNEVSRMRREVEQVGKMHEDMRTQLNSECEKAIEEVRRKYNVLLQEAETPLVQKKKELEMIFKKTYMNRVLAEAFRFKFSDMRAGTSGQPQGGHPGGVVQQLMQASSQVNTSRPAAPQPPPPPPAAPPVQVVNTSRSAAPQPSPLPAPPAAPPVQVVNNPSALFSSNPVRLHYSPAIPSSGNHQVGGGEIRAPAPHLQPFRPTTSMPPPASPAPHMMPSCLRPPINPTIAPTMIPQPAARTTATGYSSAPLAPPPPLQDHPVQAFETLGMPEVLPRTGPSSSSSHNPGTRTEANNAADVVYLSDDD